MGVDFILQQICNVLLWWNLENGEETRRDLLEQEGGWLPHDFIS